MMEATLRDHGDEVRAMTRVGTSGGTGLGLSIVDSLVYAPGGTVGVAIALGQELPVRGRSATDG